MSGISQANGKVKRIFLITDIGSPDLYVRTWVLARDQMMNLVD